MTEVSRIPGGYIIIAKKIVDSEIWKKPPLYLKVWLYLLHRAQFKPYKNLEKGQLFVTIKEIQESCSWFIGCRKSTPTKDQIFQILNWMRNPSVSPMKATTKATMITTTKATHGMLITIDNYCVYQNPKLYESNDEGNGETDTKATGEQRQSNNINKEGIKKIKKESLAPKKRTIVDEYHDLFFAKYGEKPNITSADCVNLNSLVKKFGYEKVVERLPLYFSDEDKFIVNNRHKATLLGSQWNKYVPVEDITDPNSSYQRKLRGETNDLF